ncbi:hypothetical protein [Mycobacterium marinum]
MKGVVQSPQTATASTAGTVENPAPGPGGLRRREGADGGIDKSRR